MRSPWRNIWQAEIKASLKHLVTAVSEVRFIRISRVNVAVLRNREAAEAARVRKFNWYGDQHETVNR